MSKLHLEIRDRLREAALDKVYWPNRARTIVSGDRSNLYQFCADYIGRGKPIIYLEFGVADGISFRQIARMFTNANSRFIGFDSFIGLPEDWLMHKKGAFSSKGVAPQIEDERVSFVSGWFQNTVPNFLKSTTIKGCSELLIHFDCDLYSSTLFLLTTLWHHFDEFYFIFDDFIHDDNVALHDFISAYPVEIKFLAQTRGGGPGPNPDCVFGHIRRSQMIVNQ